MPVRKVITQSGIVYDLAEPAEPDYTNGWVRYKDSNDESILDILKENVDGEVWQEDKVSISRAVDDNEV